ncbi:hypothetical protein Ciccas_013631 [Cichlidogyrus casuarinus]|uniref:Uncharacterized protein n=1 Tax=Cichlidogyrus casuarinus TaxID=1844966 RepID=A0ABD2PK32_9PLAT
MLLCCRGPSTTSHELTELQNSITGMLSHYTYSAQAYQYANNVSMMPKLRIIFKWAGRALMDMQYRMGALVQTDVLRVTNHLISVVSTICYCNGVPPDNLAYVVGILLTGLKILQHAASASDLQFHSSLFQRAVDRHLLSWNELYRQQTNTYHNLNQQQPELAENTSKKRSKIA